MMTILTKIVVITTKIFKMSQEKKKGEDGWEDMEAVVIYTPLRKA